MREAAIAGVKWLLDLQNRDGGIPTFCRGWTNLPFDRSSPDITAHALRAWLAWWPHCAPPLQALLRTGIKRARSYLSMSCNEPLTNPERSRRQTWTPLWFGNQTVSGEVNITYGTSRVVLAWNEMCKFHEAFPHWDYPDGWFEQHSHDAWADKLAVGWESFEVATGLTTLCAMQQADGGWGGEAGCEPASTEETALAMQAITAGVGRYLEVARGKPSLSAKLFLTDPRKRSLLHLGSGTDWLLRRVEDGTWTQPAPIGFYFAKLWYYERLYPMVFTVAALEAVARLEADRPT